MTVENQNRQHFKRSPLNGNTWAEHRFPYLQGKSERCDYPRNHGKASSDTQDEIFLPESYILEKKKEQVKKTGTKLFKWA